MSLLLPGIGAAADPNQGPGGPILVLTSNQATFGKYYAEILRTEGLNSFAVADISTVNSANSLAAYDVVILAKTSLSPGQVTALTDWVTAGGNLIAMDPDPQLATLLGINPTGNSVNNGYLLIDTLTRPGNGIVNTTLQFHGTASEFSLAGATKLATLYSTASNPLSYPAVTLRNVGLNGGQAAAFSFDLATSIVFTRQGNPAAAGQERDGVAPIRSDDMFFNGSTSDWVDLSKVSIPQADEQQRFLANLITYMNLDRKPLPRFWYLPNGYLAAVMLTGDDHGSAGWAARFDALQSLSAPGCSVANWECLRATGYIYTSTSVSDAQAKSYEANGFEVSLHITTNCADFTLAGFDAFATQQLNDFKATFPDVPAPTTNRTHCVVWSDWSSEAKVELAKGIRLDTTYYYWPPGFVNNTPGHFTGSAMPMRFADTDGTLIDVYQAVTQMTDESGQSYPFTVDTLLDRATGAEEQYGVYTINSHSDGGNGPDLSGTVVASAANHFVPVISARQMLTWLDARNASSFGALNYSGSTLSFTLSVDAKATGLRALVPYQSASGALTTLKRGGADVSFQVTRIKGFDYAAFPAVAGNYVATYVASTDVPSIFSAFPAAGATGVAANVKVAASFSKLMDPATISSSTFELRDASNNVVPATVGYDSGSFTATLLPSASLTSSGTYTATVHGGATDPRVKDLFGNSLAANFVWSFTVAGQPVYNCPCTGWDSTAAPGTASASDASSVEVGVKFRSSTAGNVTGIRFYKGTSNTGTHVGNLWTATGTLLATGTFSNETASGWQTLTFTSPVAISANVVYVASYFAPNGNYAADANYFTAGRTAGPLYFLKDGESGGNGVFQYGSASTFPSSTYGSSNYWVDIVFTTSAPTDTTAPTVLSRTPASGATGVAVGTSITAIFSEALNSSTVNSTTLALRDAANNLVPATVGYNAANNTATLTPSAALAASTTYTVSLLGGTTDPRVKDLAGNAYAGTPTWTFTTAAAQSGGCPCSVFDATAVPTVLADSDTSPVELGVKFRSDVAGNITGIRFYKAATNLGTHIGSLWSSTGTRLATATFTSETASGWQQVNFASPVAIAANTVYVASYFAPQGRYSSNTGYFAGVGADRGTLHLLQDGVSGGNGVYAYGATSSFPSATYQSTNYWVDVVFSGSTAPDTTPPTIVSRAPLNGGLGVALGSTISATFSEALNSSTVSSATFDLRDAAGNLVPATVTYNSATSTATLAPSSALAASTTYTATLHGGVIKDLAGNALAADSTWSFTTLAPSSGNPIVAENALPGNPASEWDVSGAGDATIQGFATDISVNRGTTISFKVNTPASAYRLDIYRLGYYGGLGARKIATVSPSATLPQSQPACVNDAATGLVDCGNWAVSASWAVPANATSGVYIARLVRTDTPGASHIVFIVRDDASTSDLLFQTSDTTWQAYNQWGGNSLYTGSPAGRAYKVSYNRPFNTRSVDGGQDWLFNAEYPMIRWLEANGFNVSYATGLDSDRLGSLIRNHKAFLSVGHDEYWSAGQRTNVEQARDAGVHLAFFSGNEVFWKTRWENSIAGTSTPNRTLVSYKETTANAKIDPLPNVWTGTWRDPRFSPPADGGRPENALTGTIFMVNDCGSACTTSIVVPEADGKMRFWRNTTVATLASGASATLPNGTVGYEWDVDADNGFRPAGLIRMSTTTLLGTNVLQDYGSTYGPGDATHSLTLYRAPSGALVFGAGTIQWAWGLDANHDRGGTPSDPNMQQATVNVLADMGVQPATLQAGLSAAAKSTDTISPTSVITFPAAGASLVQGSPIVISGTASDAGGGVVGGIELSVDGGTTWRRASGRSTWTYSWTPTTLGSVTIKTRAADDSGNIETPAAGVAVNVSSSQTCPCSVWDASVVPAVLADSDTSAVELGVKFRADVSGSITGIRFYKGTGNGGTHIGSLWSSGGTRLGTATFTNETASGWQQVSFASPVAITANTVYVASYFAPLGHYSADSGYFTSTGADRGALHFLQNGVSGGNGVYSYGSSSGFPSSTYNSTNYWVDVIFTPDSGPAPVTVPNVVNFTQAAATTAITSANLVVGTVTTQSSATVPSGSVISQNPASGTSVAPGSAVALVVSTGPATPVNVPNVVNLTQAAATSALTGAGLTVGTVTQQSSATVPAGNVISQNPGSGTSVAPGSAVDLVVSLGVQPVTVPNVVGQTQATASTAITGAGLTVGTVTQQSSATVPAGNVISQNPAAGASVASGSAVALVVSTGPALVSVPTVVSLTQAAATTAITGAGLTVGTVTQQSSATVAAGTVISQNPTAGTSVASGSAVALVVSSGPPNVPPVVTNPGPQTSAVGQTATLQMVATDANGDTVTFTSSGRPTGVAMSTAGRFSGKPTTVGVYNVTVTGDDGKGGTNAVTFTWQVTLDTTAPTTPTLSAPTKVNGNPRLSWTASTDNVAVTGYRIYRSTDGSLGSQFATTASGTRTWTDTTVVEGQAYTYAVAAYDAAGNTSVPSALRTVTAGAAPSTPTGLAATTSGGQVQLTWTASTDNVAVVGYIINRSSTNSTGVEIARTTTPTPTSWVDTTATVGTRYYYQVRAYDAANYISGYSNRVNLVVQ